MLRRTFLLAALPACATLLLARLPAVADEKKADQPALAGAWAKKGADLTLEFADKDVLKISPHGNKAEIIIVCKYSTAKDGLVKAKITDFEGKEELTAKAKQILPAGLEFTFKCQIKKDTATFDDLKGEGVDLLKSHLEGDYEKK